MRLIDADRVLRLVDNGNLISNSNYQKVRKLIENIPSIDLVRCRDCKYQNKGENESESWNLCIFRPWLYIPTSDDHFCGNGERGDSDDNQ